MPANFTINGLKTFTGTEGYGFNVNLLRDGKKVALIADMADGGPIRIDFIKRDPVVEAEFLAFAKAAYVANDRPAAYEASMREFMGADAEIKPESDDDIMADWANERVAEAEERKMLMRSAKTATLFRVKGDKRGEWRTIPKHPYSQKAVDFITGKYGDQIETIFNPATA